MRRILIESNYAVVWRDLMEGITLYIRERHLPWQLHCVSSEEFPSALDQRPDGVLCLLQAEETAYIEKVRQTNAPAVNLLRDVFPHLPSVLSDHKAIGARAADHFLGLGFKQFAFVGPDRDWSRLRFEGFDDRLRAAGCSATRPDKPFAVQDLRAITDANVMDYLQQWLRQLPRPVAIFCAADFVARTLLEAALATGARVPEEIALLGVDNDVSICSLAPVPLSSIPQNLPRIGFEAARLLDGLLSNRRRPNAPLLVGPKDLVTRRSTDFFAFDDQRVSAALRFIHSRPIATVTMKDLMRETNVSRQWLDRRFKALIGRTPSQEIRRLKLEYMCSLLTQTHLSVQEIGRRCGFSHGENLTRFFHDSTGMSPTTYRQKNLLQSR